MGPQAGANAAPGTFLAGNNMFLVSELEVYQTNIPLKGNGIISDYLTTSTTSTAPPLTSMAGTSSATTNLNESENILLTMENSQ